VVYLASGPRKGKKLVGAREEKLNAGNVSELFCELLVWDLKKEYPAAR